MKYLLTLFTVLILTITYSQKSNIYVEYNVIIKNEPELFKYSSIMRNMYENSMRDSNLITFGLIINKNGSKFLINKELQTDNTKGTVGFTLAMMGYSGIVYNIDDKLLIQNPLLGVNIYLETDLKSNWVLTGETKLIDNYLCYKATNIKKVTNKIKTFEHPVTAWYCPKLPYSYGPNGYGNLPGLVLELQIRNVVFGAKKIKLDSELDFDINSLKKIKKLNNEEIDKAYEKFNDFKN